MRIGGRKFFIRCYTLSEILLKGVCYDYKSKRAVSREVGQGYYFCFGVYDSRVRKKAAEVVAARFVAMKREHPKPTYGKMR